MKSVYMAAAAIAVVAAGAAFGPAIAQTTNAPARQVEQRSLEQVTRAEDVQKIQQQFAKVTSTAMA